MTRYKESTDEIRSVRVREVAESIQYGHTASAISRKEGPRFLRITDIQNGGVDWDSVPSCDIVAEELPKYKLSTGDLVFARTGATTGKSFLIRDCPDAVFASYLIRVRASKEVDPRYLGLFFQSPDYWRQIERGKRGIGQPNVNGKVLGEIELPLPNLERQRRIVEEIEKQFTRLEAGVAPLRRTQANLKRYRAGVLKAACEGRLVPTEAELAKAENRKFDTGEELLARILAERRQNWQGRGRYKEPAGPDDMKLSALAEGWTWACLNAISSLENGDRSNNYPSRSAFVESGIPFINAGHLDGGSVQMAQMNFITEERYNLLRAGKVRTNDLLFCLRGSLGKTAIIQNVERGAIASSLVIVRPFAGVLPKYLLCYLTSPFARQQIKLYDNGSAQPNLAGADLGKFVVPLPSLAEQTRIVAEVERRWSVVEELEVVISANLQRATRLRQSILHQAFWGDLD